MLLHAAPKDRNSASVLCFRLRASMRKLITRFIHKFEAWFYIYVHAARGDAVFGSMRRVIFYILFLYINLRPNAMFMFTRHAARGSTRQERPGSRTTRNRPRLRGCRGQSAATADSGRRPRSSLHPSTPIDPAHGPPCARRSQSVRR